MAELVLPASIRDAWRPLGTRTEERRIALAAVVAETTLYEHVATATALDGLRGSDVPVRSLFAIDLSFRPSLSSLGVSPAAALPMAAPQAERQFVESVEDDGLVVDGERSSERFERADGAAGRRYVLDVSYPLDPADGGDTAWLDAETHVAVWPTDRAYRMAGGTFPLADADGVAGAEGLVAAPERDRETVLDVVRTVELADDGDVADEDENETARGQ